MNQRYVENAAFALRARANRRQAIHGLGLAGVAALLARGPVSVMAQTEATPAASPASALVVGADGLDARTKDYLAQALWLDEWDEAALTEEQRAAIHSEKNSNAAFGERMTARLRALVDDPESFTPSYADRYAAFIDQIDAMSAHQVYAMSNLLGPDNAQHFNALPAKADFVFPQRHAVDLDRQVGWYFVVGTGLGADGKEYGVEIMFFRNSILPPEMAEAFGISPAENQITEFHLAVTESGGKHLRAIPFVVSGTTGLLDFNPDGLGWTVGNNVIESLEPTVDALPLHVRGRGINRESDETQVFGIDIVFDQSDPISLQGVEGCDPCCDGAGTLYYSITNLRPDPTRSTITVNGETIELVDGTFWFDHQWGTSLVASPKSEVTRAAANLSEAALGGWDWFMAQFDDGHQMSGSSLHTVENLPFFFQDGPEAPGVMVAPVRGRLMSGDGSVLLVNGTVTIDEWVRSTSTPDPAIYRPSNTWYPNRWTYAFGDDVPEYLQSFVMVPIVDGGQSGYFAHGAQYSEGATVVFDAEGNEIGRGFGESVNYADTVDVILQLAGLPSDEEGRALLQRPEVTPQLKAESMRYVLAHGSELEEVLANCIGI